MIEQLWDLDNLYAAYRHIRPASSWKEETQRYDHNLIPNLINLSNRIKNGTYVPGIPRGFMLNERGKQRFIESRSMDDRIVLRTVHDTIVLPAIMPKIIYDNAASIKNRGTDFFRKRLEIHLKQFASHHGNDGYILLCDFTKFFDNIPHVGLLNMLSEVIPDKASMDFIAMLVYSNAVDVSYMNDAEYTNCMNVPFNSLEYHQKVNLGQIKLTGEKFMYKSMGIGSQLSQDAGVFYPHRIDNYIKIVKSIKGYGRYMDDFYIIHESKDFLWDLLNDISNITRYYGMFLNSRKTQIVSLKHEFTILQTRYMLQPNGYLITMPNNDTYAREHRKLKKQAELLMCGEIQFNNIYNAYKSWRGSIMKHNNGSESSVIHMDEYFNHLFIDHLLLLE